MEIAGLALAVVWVASAVAATRRALSRGYPVVLVSLVMGPLGLLAILRLTRRPRPSPLSRHLLLQWATLAREGLPSGPLPQHSEPRLTELAERARKTGTLEAFAAGLQDLVDFERCWDRMLPWLVLNRSLPLVGGALLLMAAGAAFRSEAPIPGLLALAGLPVLGITGGLLKRGRSSIEMSALLERGRALHVNRLEALVDQTSNDSAEGQARVVREDVGDRLSEERRTGRVLGLQLAGLGALVTGLFRLLE